MLTIANAFKVFARGATIQFATNFYDANGVITQPAGAVVSLFFQSTDEQLNPTTQVAMSPPSGLETRWTALWDTRNVGPGPVNFSIHATGSVIPFSVEDGSFSLKANNANLVTF